MKFIKKYWYILLLLVITLGLGVVTYLTSLKLSTTEPVAPSVPQQKPKAIEPACTLEFSINVPTGSPTITPTKSPVCYGPCSTDADCLIPPGSSITLVCGAYPCPPGTKGCLDIQVCYNPSCQFETDCLCEATPTPTRTPTPTSTGAPTQTPTGVPTSTPTPGPSSTPTNTTVPTATSTPPPGCNSSCTDDTGCPSGMSCQGGFCRNPSCPSKTNCTCDVPTGTPFAPQVPVSGTSSFIGAAVVIGGIILLLLGLAL